MINSSNEKHVKQDNEIKTKFIIIIRLVQNFPLTVNQLSSSHLKLKLSIDKLHLNF